MRIDGAAANDYSGCSVAGAGDVNGDGIDDLIVGAPSAGNTAASGSGATYVVFGTDARLDVDLATDARRRSGFRLDGADGGRRQRLAVAGAGDVNGDGIDDLIVGASGAGNSGRSDAGASLCRLRHGARLCGEPRSRGARRRNGFRLDGDRRRRLQRQLGRRARATSTATASTT